MIIAISITLFFIILRFTVTVFNFISNPKLTKVNRPYNDLVSILVPARNEEDDLLTLLESIQRQDYQNYEVIIYDDESTDRTYEICTEFASGHSRFSVIKGTALPYGWTGKNYACSRLAKQAKGAYLLFLDADGRVNNGLINSTVHRMKAYKLGLLSLFAHQLMQTPGEKNTVPLVHYLLLNLLPLRLVFLLKNPAIAAASGQFMLFDAIGYRQNKWHNLVKDSVAGDAEIMKRIKAASLNGEVLLANGMLVCRIYKGYREAISGFSKNLPAIFNYSVPGMLIYILLLIGGPMLVMITLNFNMIFFMAGLIILTRIMISLNAGENALYNVFLHPVQMLNLAIIAFLSIQKHLTKSIVWKGRQV